MSAQTRFKCPSASLTLTALLKRTQRTLSTGLALAMAAHGVLTQLRGLAEDQRIARPLTTQFVKRQPRLTKPLELKKRARPRRRPMQRTMVSVKAHARGKGICSRTQSVQVLGSLAPPRIQMGRSASFSTEALEPQAMAQIIEGARESKHTLNMSLELLDIGTLDTGQYHALVVYDPRDKRSVRGFCHLAIIYSENLHYPTSTKAEDTFEAYVLTGFLRLSRAMNEYTDIETDVLGRFSLDDAEIFKAPWLLFPGWRSATLTPGELENLGTYLTSGGFVFADCANHLYVTSPSYTSLRNTLVDGLATQGIEAIFEKLPNEHAVYHCYFDFDGPPAGGDGLYAARYPASGRVVDYLEGLAVKGRLVALLSSKTYVAVWTFWGTSTLPSSEGGMDAKRQLQFGVNTIIFALTQEGSITHRLMDSIR